MISRVKAFCAALALAALAASPRAQTVRVESESFVPANGAATVGSGPNATGVVGVDGLRAISPPGAPKEIGYFDAWDWLEYDVTIPSDGTYSIAFRYSSNPGASVTNLPTLFTFYTSGQQLYSSDATPTGNWDTMVVYTMPSNVALKAGANRFRLAIRPDTVSGPSMNMDYLEFTRVGDYPALSAISGTVTGTVGAAATPLSGALVYVGADYQTAQYVTRTDAAGHYTLHVPAGSTNVSVFANGFGGASASVPAPGAHDFALALTGKYEAELLDATNPGFQFGNGLQAQYATTIPGLSNNGQLAFMDSSRYADFNSIYAPADGVYDVWIHYANGAPNTGHLKWQANGGISATSTYAPTASSTDYADSAKVLLELKQGANKLHMLSLDRVANAYANIDYLTVAPTTQPYGRFSLTVKTGAGAPIAFAAVTLTGTTNLDSVTGSTDANGAFTAVLRPDTYSVTVAKGGNTVTDSVAIAAGASVSRDYTLNITTISVEGEDFVASGPRSPAADIVSLGGASGGTVIENFTGKGNTDLGQSNYSWAEWVVNVPVGQAGLYQVSIHYATSAPGGENALDFWTTSTHLYTFSVDGTASAADYADYAYATLTPLKEGQNRFRMTMVSGGLNIDYFTFQKIDAAPAMVAFTGTVTGSDGSGTGPIANALVYVPSFMGNLTDATNLALTNDAGQYTLNVPVNSGSVGYYDLAFSANGYTTQTFSLQKAPTVKNVALSVNNPDAVTPKAERLDFLTYENVTQSVNGLGAGTLATAYGELSFVQPSPDTWVELLASVPRAGAYTISANLGSNWPPADQPGHLIITVNGSARTASVAKTGDYATHVTVPLLTNAILNAGRNTIRVTFPDAAFNISYFDLVRTGDAPVAAPTDINASGVTDIVDAVIYARRLSGADPATAPDVTGDGKSDAADVIRILKVAGGLS
ncbi:MAG TPA: carboxypeptidase regulatory-like domain-containing protein [Armatimonadota bacterium]|jgi:hypothetical protein